MAAVRMRGTSLGFRGSAGTGSDADARPEPPTYASSPPSASLEMQGLLQPSRASLRRSDAAGIGSSIRTGHSTGAGLSSSTFRPAASSASSLSASLSTLGAQLEAAAAQVTGSAPPAPAARLDGSAGAGAGGASREPEDEAAKAARRILLKNYFDPRKPMARPVLGTIHLADVDAEVTRLAREDFDDDQIAEIKSSPSGTLDAALAAATRQVHAPAVRALLAQGADASCRAQLQKGAEHALHAAIGEAARDPANAPLKACLMLVLRDFVAALRGLSPESFRCTHGRSAGRPLLLALVCRGLSDVALWFLKGCSLGDAAGPLWAAPPDLPAADADGRNLLWHLLERAPATLPEFVAAVKDERALAAMAAQRAALGGETPLMKAAGLGEVAAARLLLRLSPDPAALDRRGESAAFHAARGGSAEALALFLRPGDPAAAQLRNKEGQTLLHVAAQCGSMDVARRLCDTFGLGAGADEPDSGGRTPLILASAGGRAAVVQFLIDAGRGARGADLTAGDASGRTALHYALQVPHVDTAAALLRGLAALPGSAPYTRSVLLETTYSDGRTPLMALVGRPGALPVVEALLQAGADPNARDREGRTAAMYLAVHKGAAGPHSLDTSLAAAVVRPYDRDFGECLRLLAGHGADLAARDSAGRTALHYAVRDLADPVGAARARALAQTGGPALYGVADDRGRTPLAYAAIYGFGRGGLDVFAEGSGADALLAVQRDADGMCPLLWAAVSGCPETRDLAAGLAAADQEAKEKAKTKAEMDGILQLYVQASVGAHEEEDAAVQELAAYLPEEQYAVLGLVARKRSLDFEKIVRSRGCQLKASGL